MFDRFELVVRQIRLKVYLLMFRNCILDLIEGSIEPGLKRDEIMESLHLLIELAEESLILGEN